MKCKDACLNISLHIDNKLSLEDVAVLMEHLDNCPKCRQVYKDLKNIKIILCDRTVPQLNKNFTNSAMNAIKKHKKNDNDDVAFIGFVKKHFVMAAAFIFVVLASAVFFAKGPAAVPKQETLSHNSAVEYCLNYDNYANIEDLYEEDIVSFLIY